MPNSDHYAVQNHSRSPISIPTKSPLSNFLCASNSN